MENIACRVGFEEETPPWPPAASEPAPGGSGPERHDGSAGFWLRGPAMEVFVAVAPVFRLLAPREPGGASLTADNTVAQQGLRLACMEPAQTPTSFEVGNQPATVLERTLRGACVRLSPYRGLRYTVTLTLDRSKPLLRLACDLENLGDGPRQVACWSVLSFARRGSIVVPWDGQHPPTLPDWTPWPQPGVHLGKHAVAAHLGGPLHGPAYKVGVVAPPGWIALHRGAEALVSFSPFEPSATYPEGGANVTFFEAEDGAEVSWCEIEHVGPLRWIARGQAVRFTQAVQLVRGVVPASAEPAALRAAIESRMLPVVSAAG